MATATRAADFLGTIGVNTHIDFAAYGYQNLSVVEQAINYLGIHNLRDSAASSADVTLWQQVAQATGAKFDAYIGETSPAGMQEELALMPKLAQAGLLNFIEGGNEEDDAYPASLGNTIAITAQFQQQVWAMGQQLGLPVINMSFGAGWTSANNWQGDYDKAGDLSPYATFGNAHTYPGLGQTPDQIIQALNSDAKLADSADPVITTEIGWDMNAGFSQDQVARYALDTTMDGLKDGDPKTYFYALFNDGSGGFGLMNQDGSPTPAGTALHNLTSLLADSGAGASTFTPGSLAYSLSGQLSGDNQELFEKSDGSFWLSLWNEGQSSGASHQVTVTLPGPAEVKVFDPLTGTAALSDVAGASSVTVAVPDHPVLLEILPAAQPVPTPTPSPVPTPTPAPTPAGPDSPALTLPAAETVAAGGTVAIAGVSISDPWAAGTPGTLALNITDAAGSLTMGGHSYGAGIHISGTLAQLNADLASLSYTAGATSGSDTIAVDVWNQAGQEAARSVSVKIGAAAPVPAPTPTPAPAPQYDVTLDPSSPSAVITQSSVSVGGTGSFSVFIGGSHDTLVLTGGGESVYAFQGQNTIKTGAGNDSIRVAGSGNTIDAGAGRNTVADSGAGNTLVMPGAGGFDDVYGYVLQNSDMLDFRAALAGTAWDGSKSTVGQFLHVSSPNGADAMIGVSTTPGGSVSPIADLHGAGPVSLTQLLAHSTL